MFQGTKCVLGNKMCSKEQKVFQDQKVFPGKIPWLSDLNRYFTGIIPVLHQYLTSIDRYFIGINLGWLQLVIFCSILHLKYCITTNLG